MRGLVGELRVHVDDVVGERPGEERVVGQDVVEGLRVALEHVAVALVLGQRVHQVVEHPALQDRDGVRPLEVVEVAVDHDVRVRIVGEDRGDEVVDDLSLLVPLHLRAPRGRLEVALERLVAALGVEMVRDHEQVMAVEQELAR